MATNTDETDSTDSQTVEAVRQMLREEGVSNQWEPAEHVAPEEIVDPDPDAPLRGRYIERYQGDVHDPKSRRRSTLVSKKQEWRLFCQWFDTEIDAGSLAGLGPHFATTYQDWVRRTTDKINVSVGRHLTRIKHVIQFCQNRHLVNPDYPEAWDIPETRKQRDEYLTPERGKEISQWLADHRPYHRVNVEWVLAFRLGLRASAIRNIDLDSVVLDPDPERADVPYIRLQDRPDAGPDNDQGLHLKGSKSAGTGYRDRLVPMDQYTGEVIEGYIRYNRTEHDPPYKYPDHDPGLLTTERSARISGSAIQDDICWITAPVSRNDPCECDYCRDNELTRKDRAPRCERSLPPHAVRHGAITRMANEHRPWDAISQLVGTSPNVLREVYDRGDEYDKLDRVAEMIGVGGEE